MTITTIPHFKKIGFRSKSVQDGYYIWRRIHKHKRPDDMLRGHWTDSGWLPFTPATKMNYEGEKNVPLSRIIIDLMVWPLPVPAELFVLPMCGMGGCVNPDHLGLFTISELRSFVRYGKVEKARKLRLRNDYLIMMLNDMIRGHDYGFKIDAMQKTQITIEYDLGRAEARVDAMSAKEELAEAVRAQLLHHMVVEVRERTEKLLKDGSEAFRAHNNMK